MEISLGFFIVWALVTGIALGTVIVVILAIYMLSEEI
jgi:hypothetical protein